MNTEVEKYIVMLSSSDSETRKNGYDHLWSLEENAEISPLKIAGFLEKRDNQSLCRYALNALGRLRNKETFKLLNTYFEECNDLIMLLECIDTFKKIRDGYFLDAVFRKLGYKKALVGGKYKKNDKMWEKQKSIRSFILTGALDYMECCLEPVHTDFIEDLLKTSIGSTRWHALKAVMERKLPVSRDIIADIRDNDPKSVNKRQAQLILEIMFGEESVESDDESQSTSKT